MSFALADLEEAFLTRLAELPLAVESFPARPQDYILTHPKGAVLVAYGGSDFSPPQAMGAIVQERTVRFNLVLMARNLRTHTEGLPWLDALRGLLTGFTPAPGATKAYPQRESFLQEDAGVWSWEMVVAFVLPNLELDDGELGALLKHVTTLDSYERTETIRHPDGSTTYEEIPVDV